MYKALAISLFDLDANATYYDGTYVYYSKFERSATEIQPLIDDFLCLKNKINLDFDQLDDLVLDVNPAFVEKYFINNAEMIAAWNAVSADLYFEANEQLKNQLGLKTKKVWILSNHYMRSLTGWMLTDDPINIAFVFDAADNGNNFSIYRGDKLVKAGSLSTSSILSYIKKSAEYLNLKDTNSNSKFSDLQAYGKLDFKFLNELRNYDLDALDKIFNTALWDGFKKDKLVAHYTLMDWARNVHTHIGELLVKFFEQYTNPDETIFYTGNLAQNKLWNKQLKLKFPDLFIPPHYRNDGNSLGGVEWLRKRHNLPKLFLDSFPYCQSDKKPDSVPSEQTIALAASLLANGKVIAWYQGNGEMGFESLGNRSILSNPQESKSPVAEITNKENFELFPAAVLDDSARNLFVLTHQDEFLLCGSNVKESDLDLQAIMHVDKSSKVQVVTDRNPVFKSLISEFYNLTKCPVLLNESLRTSTGALVSDPNDALELYNNSEIDAVFIGDDYYIKSV